MPRRERELGSTRFLVPLVVNTIKRLLQCDVPCADVSAVCGTVCKLCSVTSLVALKAARFSMLLLLALRKWLGTKGVERTCSQGLWPMIAVATTLKAVPNEDCGQKGSTCSREYEALDQPDRAVKLMGVPVKHSDLSGCSASHDVLLNMKAVVGLTAAGAVLYGSSQAFVPGASVTVTSAVETQQPVSLRGEGAKLSNYGAVAAGVVA
eukprot:6464016-Amphidinium_carterae.1